MNRPTDPSDLIFATTTMTARIVGGVAGFAFAGIGLTVLIFLWSAPWDGWDSPPLFFRIFGSLIAIVFVAVGGTLGIAAVKGGKMIQAMSAARSGSIAGSKYQCPQCGAALPKGADVSPLGDVRCPYCNNWFNVHGK